METVRRPCEKSARRTDVINDSIEGKYRKRFLVRVVTFSKMNDES